MGPGAGSICLPSPFQSLLKLKAYFRLVTVFDNLARVLYTQNYIEKEPLLRENEGIRTFGPMLVKNRCLSGIKVTDKEFAEINIARPDLHGD